MLRGKEAAEDEAAQQAKAGKNQAYRRRVACDLLSLLRAGSRPDDQTFAAHDQHTPPATPGTTAIHILAVHPIHREAIVLSMDALDLKELATWLASQRQ